MKKDKLSINTLIDLALDTKDEEWFNELVVLKKEGIDNIKQEVIPEIKAQPQKKMSIEETIPYYRYSELYKSYSDLIDRNTNQAHSIESYREKITQLERHISYYRVLDIIICLGLISAIILYIIL